MSNKRLVVIVVFVLSGCGGRSNAGADARDAALGMDVDAFVARLAGGDEFLSRTALTVSSPWRRHVWGLA